MSPLPAVSICIPSYNQAAFIDRTVTMALEQDYPEKEIIVVDDASTDGTWEKLQRFSGIADVHLSRNDANMGMGENWNRCIERSRGEYVKFFLGDDTFSPDCVSVLADAARRNPDAALVFSARDFLLSDIAPGNAARRQLGYLLRTNRLQRALAQGGHEGKEILNRIFPRCDNIVGEPSSTLIRRAAFHDAGFFDPSFRQLADLEMWIRLLVRFPAVYVKSTLGAWRIHAGQATRKNVASRVVVSELVRIYDKHASPLSKVLRRDTYELFAWYIFMDSVVHRSACLGFLDEPQLRRARRNAYADQGKLTGLVRNVIRHLGSRDDG